MIGELLLLIKVTVRAFTPDTDFSCKAAVKGNHKLSYEEASVLINQLMKLENPFHCPHGRPVTIELSKYEIEKKFKRVL